MKLGFITLVAFAMIAPVMGSAIAVPNPACQADIVTLGDGEAYLVFENGELMWIYHESNDLPGLQRGGDAVHGLGTDVCFELDEEGNPTGNYDTPIY